MTIDNVIRRLLYASRLNLIEQYKALIIYFDANKTRVMNTEDYKMLREQDNEKMLRTFGHAALSPPPPASVADPREAPQLDLSAVEAARQQYRIAETAHQKASEKVRRLQQKKEATNKKIQNLSDSMDGESCQKERENSKDRIRKQKKIRTNCLKKVKEALEVEKSARVAMDNAEEDWKSPPPPASVDNQQDAPQLDLSALDNNTAETAHQKASEKVRRLQQKKEEYDANIRSLKDSMNGESGPKQWKNSKDCIKKQKKIRTNCLKKVKEALKIGKRAREAMEDSGESD
ncbi:unnamed protein product [Caenorhabditis nigoni]